MKFKTEKNLIFLLLIIAAGLFFRLYQLPNESIYLDEAYSIELAQKSFVHNVHVANYHPPLYQIFLHFWIKLFGISETATRMLSVLFSTISIYLIYRAAALLFDRRTGLISAFLFSISEFQIYYAQEVRSYALFVMLSLASLIFFVKIIRKNKLKDCVFYLCFSVLLLYTHYYALFIVLAQNIYFLYFVSINKKDKIFVKRWIFAQAVLFVIFLPWLVILFRQVKQAGATEDFWIQKPDFGALKETFSAYISYFPIKKVLFLYSLLFGFGFFSLGEKRGGWKWKSPLQSLQELSWQVSIRYVNELVFLTLWLFCLTLIPFVIASVVTPMYVVRYTISASLAFYIITAKGIANFRGKFLLPILLCAVFFSNSASMRNFYALNVKEEWREVAGYIETETMDETEIIFICADFCRGPFNYYYHGKLKLVEIKRTIKDFNELTDLAKSAYTPKTKKVWLILSHQMNSPVKEFFLSRPSLFLLEEKQFQGIELYLFELK